MEKAVILLILVLIAIVRNYLKEQKKAQERAAKRRTAPPAGPSASEAESFEDLMRKIRQAQQSTAVPGPPPPLIQPPVYTPLEPTVSVSDEEASLPPSPWDKKQAGPTTLGKPGSGFGKEEANPLGRRGAQPSSAQPTHLKPQKQAKKETEEERQLRLLAAERAALVNRLNAPLPETKKEPAFDKPKSENRYHRLLKNPESLRDAVVLQTILERKF